MTDPNKDFPHLHALASGCVSGRFSEWPWLRPEAERALARIKQLEEMLQARTAYEAGGMQATGARTRSYAALQRELLEERKRTEQLQRELEQRRRNHHEPLEL